MYQPYPPGGQQPPGPSRPTPPRPVRMAVLLMYTGAGLSAISLIVSILSLHTIENYIRNSSANLAQHLKGLMSRVAGRSLHLLTRVGTRDATNSFKAYSTDFIKTVGIDSRGGFEIGIELTAKARRLRRPVAEIPTIWLDRQAGVSNFHVIRWFPKYLRWYRFAFGPQLTPEQIRVLAGTRGSGRPAVPPAGGAAGGAAAGGAAAGGAAGGPLAGPAPETASSEDRLPFPAVRSVPRQKAAKDS